MKKISVITFGYISKNGSGPSEAILSLAVALHNKNKLHKVICLGHDRDTILSDKYFVTPSSFIFKIVRKILLIINKFICFNYRRIQEELFDFYVCNNKDLFDSDVVLFLKPNFPKTVQRLKINDRITVGWASILNPVFNCEQVMKEGKRLNIQGMSSYTDLKRVKNLSIFFKNLDKIIVQSSLAMSSFENFGVDNKKLCYLEDSFGIDCLKYLPLDKKKDDTIFRVLHISHMNLIKGVAYLFEAWRNLKLENAELLLGGKVDQNIMSIYKKKYIEKSIMLGNVPDTTKLYQMADVFISPSISDNLPNTILESMACGIPVIASNMCGLSEIISHGIDGFVYQYDNVKELQKYILWCYDNQETLTIMGHAARNTAERFQRKDFAKNIVSQLTKL